MVETMAYFVLCSETGFLCVIEPWLSWTSFVDQADLELKSLLASAPSTGIKALGHHSWLIHDHQPIEAPGRVSLYQNHPCVAQTIGPDQKGKALCFLPYLSGSVSLCAGVRCLSISGVVTVGPAGTPCFFLTA